MNFFDRFFPRRQRIGDRDSLARFIGENAAFLTQKGIYEYSRARAGHYSKVLFADPGFHSAVEESRWRAYPLGLAMVTEVAEGLLRPLTADETEKLRALVLSIFDGYSVPEVLDEDAWRGLRGELANRLQHISLHPPKPAMDIPENFAKEYFELMPIHEKLRGRDFTTTHNYLRVTLCNIHDEFTKRMNTDGILAGLRTAGT